MSHDDSSGAAADASRPGFSAYAESDVLAEQRRRRRGFAARAVTGVLVLVAVGGVAAVTSGGATKPTAAAVAGGPKVGVVTRPLPPQVLFVSAQLGYAFYRSCDVPPVAAEGCHPALFQTTDGAHSWHSLPLPAEVPVDPSRWLDVQATADHVLIANPDYLAVRETAGSTWQPVKVDTTGTSSVLSDGDFLLGTPAEPMLVVDPVAATAVSFRPPQKVELPGVLGGALPDGTLWMRDAVAIGLSPDKGVNWEVAALPNAEVESAPLVGSPSHLAVLAGPAAGMTLGQAGDGGNLPASDVSYSTDEGGSWTAPVALAGPRVNALCTVYLDDKAHHLLGVASDGRTLLSVAAGRTELVPALDQPAVTPSCLASHGALVWGATATQVVLKVRDQPWQLLDLPTGLHAVATPSPRPQH